MKNYLIVIILGLCLSSCNADIFRDKEMENPTSCEDTVVAIISLQSKDLIVNGEASAVSNEDKIPILPNFCYEIQDCNELGALIQSYSCMQFEANYGRDFQTAYNRLQLRINECKQMYQNVYNDNPSFSSDKIVIRQSESFVKNAPSETLQYIRIDLFMYCHVYKKYILIGHFGVVDSQGNLYHIETPND